MSRRRFLEVTFWSITGVTTVGVLSAAARFLTGNALEPKTTSWVQIGTLVELAPGSVHQVNYALKAKDAWRDVEDKGALYAFSVDGTSYTVLDGTCTHLGCIVQWDAGADQFACHCHAATFSRDGAVVSGPPPRPLRTLETKIEEGALWARI